MERERGRKREREREREKNQNSGRRFIIAVSHVRASVL